MCWLITIINIRLSTHLDGIERTWGREFYIRFHFSGMIPIPFFSLLVGAGLGVIFFLRTGHENLLIRPEYSTFSWELVRWGNEKDEDMGSRRILDITLGQQPILPATGRGKPHIRFISLPGDRTSEGEKQT